MKPEDKQKFTENITWFNQFFENVRQLFERIAQGLKDEYDLPNKVLYYSKTNSKPTIPKYHMIGLGGPDFAIQILAVFDYSLLSNQNVFKVEPSFIIVKHSQGNSYSYVDDFGLKIVKNEEIEQLGWENNKLSGKILKNQTYFHAFQILFDDFAKGQDIDDVIQTQIIEQLQQLPDW